MIFEGQQHNPDVLTCLANLSSDEVFTPPTLVNRILDILPSEIWETPDTTFLDPCTKSGVFLREITKRLLVGLENEIPDKQERIDHILGKQVFGLALTELTALLSRRSLYCSKYADGKYSVASCFETPEGNIIYRDSPHSWKGKSCEFCGASKKIYERKEGLEHHAYEFIHSAKRRSFNQMKFDVIIGNPPYQMSDGGFGKSARPIYHKFVETAKQLNPRYLAMIIPSRWFAEGKGLDDFRDKMLNDSRIKKIVDFPDAGDCFPGVDIAGGVCYFLWDKAHQGNTEVVNIWKGKVQSSKRKLDEFNTFVRFGYAADIIHKVNKFEEIKMNTVASSRKPFGLPSNTAPLGTGELTLIYRGGGGAIPRHLVTDGQGMIDKWKVLTSKVSYDHAGQPNKDGQRRVLSKIIIAPPNTVCTETYLVVAALKNEEECHNLAAFLKLKFTRFLIAQMSFSQNITKDRFSFVPFPDCRTKHSDSELYAKYKLTDGEIEFIEHTIMEMN